MGRILKTLAALAVLVAMGAAQAGPISGQGTWETTLLGRDINGNAVDGSSASAVFLYDRTLNITWLRDANVMNGQANWESANHWATTLDVYGLTGWRLPAMIDTGAPGCDWSLSGGTDCAFNVQTKSGNLTQYEVGQTVYSEMAHLWYETLGNKAYYAPVTGVGPQSGYGLTNTGDFQNLQIFAYWSGTSLLSSGYNFAWFFEPASGYQNFYVEGSSLYAMAVRDGDVLRVPEPATLALVGAALLGAAATRKRRPSGRNA